jgi:hypothetical protein
VLAAGEHATPALAVARSSVGSVPAQLLLYAYARSVNFFLTDTPL